MNEELESASWGVIEQSNDERCRVADEEAENARMSPEALDE